MQRYIVRRLLLFVPTLLGVSILIFLILRVVPGDVALLVLIGPDSEAAGSVTEQALDQIRVELELADEKTKVAQALVRVVETAPPQELASVIVVPQSVKLQPNRRIQFAAIGLDQDSFATRNVDVRWEVTDPEAGRISNEGLFTAGGKFVTGGDVVQATLASQTGSRGGEKIGTASVSIVEEAFSQKLVSASIFPTKVLLQKRDRFRFTGFGLDRAGDFVLDSRFRWEADDPNSLTLNDLGQLSAVQTLGDFHVTVEVIETQMIPIYRQYYNWISSFVQGDLGTSYATKTSVARELFGQGFQGFIQRSRFMATLEIAVLAVTLSALIGIPLGIIMALRQDSWIDYALRVLTITGLAMPTFWTATLVILGLTIYFDWLPPLGYKGFFEDPITNLKQIAWAVVPLGFNSAAFKARLTRSQMLEILRQDYVRTARSKGLMERVVIYRHALKNAMLPVITIIGLQFAILMGGTVIIEVIFNVPGLGRTLIQAIGSRDYPVVQALVMLFALILVVSNLLVDLFYTWMDPRITHS